MINTSFNKPNPHPQKFSTGGRHVPFLAILSGRDASVLKECPDDEVRISGNLGRVRVVSMALHGSGMLSTLSIFGIDLTIASALAAITAIGLFSVDGLILAAHDRADAEDAIRRIGGTDTPKLSAWTIRAAGTVVRIGVSAVIALMFGGAIGAKIFEHDVISELNRRQAEVDAQYMAEAMESLSAERSALKLALEVARESIDARRLRADDRLRFESAKLDALNARLVDQRAILDRLNDELLQQEALVRDQRDIALCEESGSGPNCEGVSGTPGRGPLWELATSRAEAAEARAQQLREMIVVAENTVADAESSLSRVQPPSFVGEEAIDQSAVIEAAGKLADFDAEITERAAEMVEAHPLRNEADVRSLSTRIEVLHDLALASPGFLFSVLTIKAVAMCFELLPWLAAMMLHPGEYSLVRGRKLAELARDLRHQHLKEFAEDQLLHAQYERSKRIAANDALANEWVANAMTASREMAGEPANRP